MKKLLLLGATGTFGRRLADRLSLLPGLHLLLASRSMERAKALADTLGGSCEALAVDRGQDLPAVLVAHRPFVVVDCSGPFQQAQFETASAAVAAGCHYVDIADGRAFLEAFPAALASLAEQNNVVALCGASSTPCLSVAVVAALTEGWQRVDSVDMAILPDGRMQPGLSLVQSTLHYAGTAIPGFRHGRATTLPAWRGGRRLTIPGLPPRTVSPVDTLDATLLPRLFNVQSCVCFSAGLASPLEQWGLRLFAGLRHCGLIGRSRGLAPILAWAGRALRRRAPDGGGMAVEVQGINAAGQSTKVRWTLTARDGHGPFVPILPVVALVRQLMCNTLRPGARLAAGELACDAIVAESAGLNITTDVSAQLGAETAFKTALGLEAHAALEPAVRAFHAATAAPVWSGRAGVSRGTSLLSRLVGWFLGLPKTNPDCPVSVSVEREAENRERWTRLFGPASFHSLLTADGAGELRERFGATQFQLGLQVESGHLLLPVARGWLCGLPLPRALLPQSEAREFSDPQGRFNFDVKLSLPIGGLLVHYRGWLVPDAPSVQR